MSLTTRERGGYTRGGGGGLFTEFYGSWFGHWVKSIQIRSFFSVRIFLYSDWTQKITDQKKLRIWTLFMRWCHMRNVLYKVNLKKPVKANTRLVITSSTAFSHSLSSYSSNTFLSNNSNKKSRVPHWKNCLPQLQYVIYLFCTVLHHITHILSCLNLFWE